MRKVILLAAGVICSAAPLTAQSWDTEFGIQGGFSRFKPTGTGGSFKVDVYGLPSAMVLSIDPTTPAAFAILPIGEKLALEPALSFIQSNSIATGPFPTFAALSLRADYAITHQLYGALGLYSRYAGGSPGGTSPYPHFQLGLEAAAGYRLYLAPHLNGRIEIQAVTVKKQDTSAPFNVYSLLFGLSTPLSEPQAGAARRGAAPAEPHGAWRPELGVSAGYANVHLDRGPDFTVLSFPGSGASSFTGFLVAPTAPSLFVLVPLTERLATEVGFDAMNLRIGSLTYASFQLAPRADLAFGNRWYGALGPQFHFLRQSATKTLGVTGVTAAWGFRFHLAGALAGRFEASYGVNAKRRMSVGFTTPSSVFGLNFGMMMPLK